ncbi:hypothetical protein LY76DRAFT_642709 [Colletotrichum caudatum]|nr:hypothetical protein LY76DRAFT_642709 [Colletotrichum caudatum]
MATAPSTPPKNDDYCGKIAASFMLTEEELESFNKNTWGWSECKPLYPEFDMCVSKGAAPMPAIVTNAVCRPTMNGTIRPPAGTNISELDPCHLNVCCNIWGQCGMTDDFCVVSKSETGAPGTSAPGKNGCISNCGRDIIKGSAPAQKIKLGYFEGLELEWLDGSGSITDDDRADFIHEEPSPCTASLSTLKQLEDRKESIPSHCLEQYIDVQIAVFDDSFRKYNKLIEDGYDSKFSTWEGYIKEQIPGQIKNFMATDKVDRYFKCGQTKTVACCNTCQNAWCGVGCERFEGCKNGKQMVPRDKCPKVGFDPTGFGGYHPNSTFTLTDREGFFKDIIETWGIEEEWITFSKRQMSLANGCQFAGKDRQDESQQPKGIIVKALPDAKGLLERYRDMKTFAEFKDDIEMSDLTDSGSLPAFAVEQAVGEMDKIVKEANEIEKKRREEFILDMIMGFLLFIPFLGPTGSSAVAAGSRKMYATHYKDARLVEFDGHHEVPTRVGNITEVAVR